MLQVMNVTVDFDNQSCLVTVKVDDKTGNDLLPAKMDSQLVRPQFLPKDIFSRRHIATEFFCALEFSFGDSLTRDDVFDGHGAIVTEDPSPVSPKGEKPRQPRNKLPSLSSRAERVLVERSRRREGRGDRSDVQQFNPVSL